MKYLKNIKLFESEDNYNKFIEIKDDISDMLLDISDLDLKISMSETEHHNYPNAFEIRISKDREISDSDYYHSGWNPDELRDVFEFEFNQTIEDTLTRIFKYLEGEEWNCFDFDYISLYRQNGSKKWSQCFRTEIPMNDLSKMSELHGINMVCIHFGFGKGHF